jgi:hypothetical protein
MKRFVPICLVALAATIFSSTASASILTVNCSVISGPTELIGNLACAQFNGAGLQSVQITVSGGIGGSITLTNNSSTSQTGTGTTTSQFNIGPLAGFGFINPVFAGSFTTGPRTVAGNTTMTFSGLTGTGSGDLGTDSGTLAPYSGAGNFNIPVTTSTGFALSGGGGNFSSAQATTANATAVVTYTFGTTSVPEPAALSLFGLGLLSFGFMSRKFQK